MTYCFTARDSNNNGGPRPGAARLADWLKQKVPTVTGVGIYAARNVGSTGKPSLHQDGRALDVMFPGSCHHDGWKVFAWAIAHAEQLGAQEIIFCRKVWTGSRPVVRDYETPPGGSPHLDHVHIGLCRPKADTLTRVFLDTLPSPLDVGEDDDVNQEQDIRLKRVETDLAATKALVEQMNEREKRQGLDLGKIKAALNIPEGP